MRRTAVFIATVGYLGHVRFAPGTVGSAAGLLLLAAARAMGMSTPTETGVTVVLIGVGVWAGTVAERHFRRHDPGPVVIDEVVGMLVTFALIPLTPGTALLGFFLFRLADVVKPYPAARLEALPGGWGIVMDDVVAGFYANVVLRLTVLASPGWLG